MEQSEPYIFLVPVVNNQTGERAIARVESSNATGAQEAAVVHMFRAHGWRSVTGDSPTKGVPANHSVFAYGRSGSGLVVDLQVA